MKKEKDPLQDRSDEYLIAAYHRHPLVLLIANILVTIGWILAFSTPSETDKALMLKIGVAVALTLVCGLLVPGNRQKQIACEMMRRHKQSGGSSNNPYFYLFSREKELTGSVRDIKVERILSGIALIFRVINVLFYLLIGLFLLALSIAAWAMIGAFWFMASVVFTSIRGHSSGRSAAAGFGYMTVFVKYAVKFIFAVFHFRPEKPTESAGSAFDSFKSDLTARSKNLSDYVSLVSCPRNFDHATADRLDLEVSGTSLRVIAHIVGDGAYYSGSHNINDAISQLTDAARHILEAQARTFAECNPDAPAVSLTLDITASLV